MDKIMHAVRGMNGVRTHRRIMDFIFPSDFILPHTKLKINIYDNIVTKIPQTVTICNCFVTFL